jgi:1-acyl-sn-glycerol-3-phosphate acyltransferase
VSFLSLLPNFSKDVLHGGETVVTLLLTMFCLGVAAGSLLCERLSRRRLELGLVPLGSIGISLFALDLAIAAVPFEDNVAAGALLSVGAFLESPGGVRLCLDLFGIAVFSGFYTVPLYTLVQQRSAVAVRSRVIAGNNILNALFMVASSLVLVGLLSAGVPIPGIFVTLALMNVAVAAYIYTVIPEFLLRFVAFALAHVLYRLRMRGDERIPLEGAAVLVANHVSFIDWLLIASTSARPVRFVMDHSFMQVPVLRWLFRDAKVIPIAPAREDPEVLAHAFERISAELSLGELVCIFPEGRITSDGEMAPFRPGIERVVANNPVPVVPVAIVGMWGSFFSRKGGPAMSRPFRRIRSRVGIVVGEPVPPEQVTAHGLAERVAALGGFPVPAPDAPPTAT